MGDLRRGSNSLNSDTGLTLSKDCNVKDYFGGNEKSKVVVKLSKVGSGVPSREPRLSEQDRKQLMLLEHRRREELKKLIRYHIFFDCLFINIYNFILLLHLTYIFFTDCNSA